MASPFLGRHSGDDLSEANALVPKLAKKFTVSTFLSLEDVHLSVFPAFHLLERPISALSRGKGIKHHT